MADGHDDIDDDQGGDHDGPYGQPLRDYAFRSESLFAESMRPRQKPAGGLKVHLSVAEEDVFPAAQVLLPTLRLVEVHHKVVRTPALYAALNAGDQRGKFITVYSGDFEPTLNLLTHIDPVLQGLRSAGIRPGPLPLSRQSRHTQLENRFGRSGMVSFVWTDRYGRD